MRLMFDQRKRPSITPGRAPGSPVRDRRVFPPALQLQGAVGNQAVLSVLRLSRSQHAMTVGRADGPLEREADAMAAHAVGGPSSSELPGANRRAIQSAQQALDPATRTFFESRFGHDFSNVRIHTSHEAAASARSLEANAYTVGSDIVFREGAYSTVSDRGRQLLAHELAHVVQQSRSDAEGQVIQRQPETQGQGQAQGHGTQVSVNSNCGDSDARAIAFAIARAEGMLNAALDWFRNSSPQSDVQLNSLLRVHFGSDSDATRNAVSSRLARVAAILLESAKANVNLHCTDEKDPACSKNEYYAYVRERQGYRINFCRSFFTMNPEEQLWGVIHETCHLAGALGDNYNFIFNADTASCYGSTAVTTTPLSNADSYVSFVWCLVKPESKIREGLNTVVPTRK
ncbi:MAG: DUF4157 domain-containing protein [Terracidiphilus sp.]